MDSSDPTSPVSEPGTLLLGRFRIERMLGRGGMGEVLLAHDELLERRVALKRVTPREGGPDVRKSILREARRASRVSDPRIATIHDVFEHGDELLLVMEYVDGVTLRQRMEKPVPLDEFWSIAVQATEAIGAAHTQGVIHRDIKPENVMITRGGHVKVLDFGIAKRTEIAEEDRPLTSTTDPLAGTPPYMAPEAHVGGNVDARSDIFSLGVVFYELLTRKHPFAAPSYPVLLDRILNRTPPPVVVENPAAGGSLSALVDRMLAKDPEDRYPTSSTLLEDLEQVRHGLAPKPVEHRTAPARRASRSGRLRWWPAAVAIAAVVGVGVWWSVWGPRGVPRDRRTAFVLPAPAVEDSDFAAFSIGALDLLSARFQRHADESGFQPATLSQSIDDKVRTADDAYRILGANLALIPAFERRADALIGRLELRDAASGRLIAKRSVTATASEPFSFIDGLARESSSMLELGGRERALSAESGIRGAGTLQFYLQGLGRYRTAKNEGDARRAVEQLEVACRTEPDCVPARAALAFAQQQLSRYTKDSLWTAKAEASARAAVAQDTQRVEGYFSLANILAAQNRQREALAEYQIASRLSPSDDWLWNRVARTQSKLGRPDLEREGYIEATRRRPHSYKPWWWLASWEYNNGHFDAATQAFREMIRRAPDFSTGYSSLGGVLVLRGHYAQAIDTLKRANQLRPTSSAYDNLGTAFFNSGRFTDAIDAYNQSFQFGDADHYTWLNLGDAYFWLRGRERDAHEAYRQGVALGRAAIEKRMNSSHTLDVQTVCVLAAVFPRLGEPDSARSYLQRALAADSTNADVQYHAALTVWQLHQPDQAFAWLEKSVRNGYPVAWLRDSPMFRDWRADPRFEAIIGEPDTVSARAASRN